MTPARPRRVGVGLVGCGLVAAEKHLPALVQLPGVSVVGVADRDPGRAAEVARRFGIGHSFGDAGSLLALPEVEAVGVCTPPSGHVAVALQALEAGRHVLVEKPLALDLDEIDRLVERAARSGLKAMTGHHMRFHHHVRAGRDVVRSGRLGEIESVRAVWNASMDAVALPDWRLCRVTGGGALVELAVHHFDAWRFLLDAQIEEVFAWSRSVRHEDDAAVVAARLSGDVLATSCLSERTASESEIEVSGHRARLHLSCLRFEGLAVHPTGTAPGEPRLRLARLREGIRELPRGLSEMRRGGDYMASYREQWRHFCGAIRADTPVDCTLEDGRQAVLAALAAVESRRRGTPLRVADAPRSLTSR